MNIHIFTRYEIESNDGNSIEFCASTDGTGLKQAIRLHEEKLGSLERTIAKLSTGEVDDSNRSANI